MNSLRNKLIASVTMLAVAAIMLTSASFAWYTVSTKGEIQQVKAELKTTENLEIARMKDDKSPTDEVAPGQADEEDPDIYWGSRITRWGAVQPLDYVATASEEGIKTASISEDGRLGSLQVANPTGTLETGVDYCVFGDKKVAVVYNARIRSNNANPITTSVEGIDDATVKVYVGGQLKSAGDTFTLDPNVATDIEVVLFFDGTNIKAKDVAEAIDGNIALRDDGIIVTFTQTSSN